MAICGGRGDMTNRGGWQNPDIWRCSPRIAPTMFHVGVW